MPSTFSQGADGFWVHPYSQQPHQGPWIVPILLPCTLEVTKLCSLLWAPEVMIGGRRWWSWPRPLSEPQGQRVRDSHLRSPCGIYHLGPPPRVVSWGHNPRSPLGAFLQQSRSYNCSCLQRLTSADHHFPFFLNCFLRYSSRQLLHSSKLQIWAITGVEMQRLKLKHPLASFKNPQTQASSTFPVVFIIIPCFSFHIAPTLNTCVYILRFHHAPLFLLLLRPKMSSSPCSELSGVSGEGAVCAIPP